MIDKKERLYKMITMEITIIEPKSYCAGVTNAINIARKAKADYPKRKIFILGKLVHNQLVINSLKQEGIETLYALNKTPEQLLKDVPEQSVLIFTAHGHDKKLDLFAHSKQLIVFDATCPKVKHNIDLIENEINNKHQVIYIGHRAHPETNAALSIDKNVLYYDVNMGIDYKKVKDKSPMVINQTTLNILDIKKNYDDILSHIPEARILEEICNTTRLRQEAVINLPNDVDLIIVVGDTYSSNTKRLFEIASNAHPDILSVMISQLSELDLSLLKDKQHIAIASGASTPMFAIDEIVEYIKRSDLR